MTKLNISISITKPLLKVAFWKYTSRNRNAAYERWNLASLWLAPISKNNDKKMYNYLSLPIKEYLC